MEESAAEKLRGQMFELRDTRRPKPEVKADAWVKVGYRNERFWCRVRVVGDDSLVGTVDNDLMYSSWRRGDEIVFQQCHVLEVAEPCDALTFRNLAASLGSFSEAAVMWREGREAKGVAVPARPRSWFSLPDDKHVRAHMQ